MGILGSGWQNDMDDSMTVRKDIYGSVIEYRWGGVKTMVSNIGIFNVNPAILTLFWFGLGALLIIFIALLIVYDLMPVWFALFWAGLGFFVILASVAYLLNKTQFIIEDGSLTVKTRPIPFRPSKSLTCASIVNVQVNHDEVKNLKGNQTHPITYINAILRTGNPIVLLKLDDERADMDRLAKEIMNAIIEQRRNRPYQIEP